ncbi:response regulator [Desulfococcaceae bacterium HSG7]|nr:response regulator [Desulfococcaceae bacterium HSG7]
MHNHKILLVDDDTLVLEFTGITLINQGYELKTAESGEEALKLLEEEAFDLVITDLVMDAIDGIDVLKAVKEKYADTMTIIFTGYGNLSSAVEALRLNAEDYLLKPCKIEDMVFRIERCLEKLELKRRIRRMEADAIKARKFETIAVMTDGIAHDYNNLLSVVMGNISLAQTYLKPDDKNTKLLSNAEKALIQIKDLTQQLFTFSENFTPMKKNIAIAPMLKSLAMLFTSESESECHFDIADNLWSVEIDRAQIGQVIRNLVLNAEDAMPLGGTIKISAINKEITRENKSVTSPGEYIEISIEDRGVGIPPELTDKIFDPYFSTKEKGVQKGMGLGLAICHSVIKKHGGYLKVKSKPGEGSVFSFLLPASSRKTVKSGTLRIPSLHTPPKISEKILVMDDEEMIRELSAEMLRRLGYDAICSDEGIKTLSLYQEAMEIGEPFDAAILDLTIRGGMGGIETMRELLKIDSQAKAIISTGYSVNEIMMDYKKYGFCGVIAKPYSFQKLHDVLSRVLEV